MFKKIDYPFAPFVEESESGGLYIARHSLCDDGPHEWWCPQTNRWVSYRPLPLTASQTTLLLRNLELSLQAAPATGSGQMDEVHHAVVNTIPDFLQVIQQHLKGTNPR